MLSIYILIERCLGFIPCRIPVWSLSFHCAPFRSFPNERCFSLQRVVKIHLLSNKPYIIEDCVVCMHCLDNLQPAAKRKLFVVTSRKPVYRKVGFLFVGVR